MQIELSAYVILRGISAVLALVVFGIALRHRELVGARSLALLMLGAAWWSLGTMFEYASVTIDAKIFWAKVEYLGVVTVPVFFLFFALEYARVERFLTRRNMFLLLVIPLLAWILAITNDWHHLIWTEITAIGSAPHQVTFGHGLAFWVLVAGYSYVMLAIGSVLLIRVALSYPRVYRTQIIAVIIGAVIPWVGNILYLLGLNPTPGMDPTPGLIVLMGAIFAWAIFRHRWFDLIPVARYKVVDTISDAMLVVDAQARIVDLNPAAENLFGLSIGSVRGQPIADVLAKHPVMSDALRGPIHTPISIPIAEQNEPNYYNIRCSALSDSRGELNGQVLVLTDVTALHHNQELAQQEALRQERASMVRELHDNLGQVLSYLSLNTQSIRDHIEQGNYTAALAQLDALSLVTQDMNQTLREYILDLKTVTDDTQTFTGVLKTYLARFEAITGLQILLSLPDEAIDTILPPLAYINLLRIIQEALANSRKHARATAAQVIFSSTTQQLQVVIADNGAGFDVNHTSPGFGLGIMQERAQQSNAELEIRSAPGQGTQVIVKFARAQADEVSAQLAGMTVLLADDHPLFVEGIKNLLTARGLTVAGVAHNGQEAVSMAQEFQPDIVLLDVFMPGGPGPHYIGAIKAVSPDTKILMLSMSADDEMLVQALQAGANGFMLKSQPSNEFFEALVAIQRGHTPLAPGLANLLAQHAALSATAPQESARHTLIAEGLSAQQIDILERISLGQPYKEISAELHISESTVKYHIDRIQMILDVTSRAQAIAYAYKIGLVSNRRTAK